MVAGRRKCMSAEKDKNCRHWQGCAPLLRLPLRSGCSFVRNMMAILHFCESSHATARMPVVDLRAVSTSTRCACDPDHIRAKRAQVSRN